MPTLRNYFVDQISANRAVTPEVEPKITFKRVWSGKLIMIGDKVLYAYLLENDVPKLFALLERELDELNALFEFVGMQDETVPVLKRRK